MKGRAFLFLEAGRRVYRFQFTKNLTLLGSERTNDIVIRDDSVEGTHAQITRAGGVYTLRSIDDSELRVDGEEVEAGYELMNGNKIEVGDTDILFAREQPESPTTVHLLIRKPGEPPMGFWSKKSTVVIGREKGDVIIDDPLLSKVHCIVENFCDGGHFLLDARSERGTGLNGESIEARHRLENGDVINAGGIEIEFQSGPFTGDAADASALAQERVQELRRRGERKVSSDVPGGLSQAPRNPYQRYPSAIPDADPPPRTDGRRSRPIDTDSTEARLRPRRKRHMDLKSGVQTGITNLGRRQGDRGRPRPRPRPRPRARGESKVPSASHPRRPEPTYEPEALPNFEPRPHWGQGSKNQRGFGDRPNEMDTRLSRGNADESGLWYLPDKPGEAPKRAKPVGKPIIRPRGDEVPEAPAEPAPSERKSGPNPRRARIRRPAKGPRGPGSSPVRPMRMPDPSAPDRRPRRAAPVPEPRRRDAPAAPEVQGGEAPGARPDAKERWYIPEEDKKAVRQRKGDAAWYLPEGKKKKRPSSEDYKDDYGDRHERPERENEKGGQTQVFNGEDY